MIIRENGVISPETIITKTTAKRKFYSRFIHPSWATYTETRRISAIISRFRFAIRRVKSP